MRSVSVPRIEPQVQREERETDALVLLHVPQLVSPQGVGRLTREDDDVTERDRGIAPTREHEMRETAVADIEKAAVAAPRTSDMLLYGRNVGGDIGTLTEERSATGKLLRYRIEPDSVGATQNGPAAAFTVDNPDFNIRSLRGTAVLRYGPTRDLVLGLEAVLPDGEVHA